jgi:hypothetical protein
LQAATVDREPVSIETSMPIVPVAVTRCAETIFSGCAEPKGRTSMKALSEQLGDLSDRAKAPARDKNREELETQRAKLRASIAAGKAEAEKSAATA